MLWEGNRPKSPRPYCRRQARNVHVHACTALAIEQKRLSTLNAQTSRVVVRCAFRCALIRLGSRLTDWIDTHAQVTTAQFVAAIAHFGVELSFKEAEAFFGRYTAELHRAGRGAALCETQPHHPSRCQRFSTLLVLTLHAELTLR